MHKWFGHTSYPNISILMCVEEFFVAYISAMNEESILRLNKWFAGKYNIEWLGLPKKL